jgi:hypothetical protein
MKKRGRNNLFKAVKSQSQIISTVLLILLVMAAMVIISGVVINIVKDNLSQKGCLDVAGTIEISDGYTCYNADATVPEMQVQVHIGAIRDSIDGFAIEMGGASTSSYKITNSTPAPTGVRMCNQSTVIYIPGDNEERTYIIPASSKPNSIRVYPILKGGKLCDTPDSVTSVQECLVQSKKCTQ